jgi:hypothetical protein
MESSQMFAELFAKAEAAGREAGAKAAVRPMVVHGGSESYFVADGVCGFAWVKVRPANSSFARWLVANDKARKDSYAGGVSISVRDYNQSMQRKEAHAYAMAAVLSDAGFKASAESRID